MTKYVLGFAFRGGEDFCKVTLIRKNKPDWQAGKYNGVGGKMEISDADSVRIAMAREFLEETGVPTASDSWVHFAEMVFTDCTVSCLTMVLFPGWSPVTMTDEKVEEFSIDRIPSTALPNLHWLIPMAIARLQGKEFGVKLISL